MVLDIIWDEHAKNQENIWQFDVFTFKIRSESPVWDEEQTWSRNVSYGPNIDSDWWKWEGQWLVPADLVWSEDPGCGEWGMCILMITTQPWVIMNADTL